MVRELKCLLNTFYSKLLYVTFQKSTLRQQSASHEFICLLAQLHSEFEHDLLSTSLKDGEEHFWKL